MNNISPWMEDTAFPDAPLKSESGFVRRGSVIGASMKDVRLAIASDSRLLIRVAWTPNLRKLLPPIANVDLHDVALARLETFYRVSLRVLLALAAVQALNVLVILAWSSETKAAAQQGLILVLLAASVTKFWVSSRLAGRRDSRFASNTVTWERFNSWMSLRTAVATPVLCTMLTLLWLAQKSLDVSDESAVPLSIAAAGLVKEAVAAEPWRLLTGGLLHANSLHLAGNVVSLWLVGRLLERLLERRELILLVFFAGVLGGNLLSLLFDSEGITVGASTGVSAIWAFLTLTAIRYRAALPALFAEKVVSLFLLLALISLLSSASLDHWAHLGGAAAGAIVGISVNLRVGNVPVKTPALARVMAGVAALLVAAGALQALVQMASGYVR